tara:strand:- start:3906 stop:4007 length:102 start_codon:yes stop_codon:yes gene_type:complete
MLWAMIRDWLENPITIGIGILLLALLILEVGIG